jgi:hypothetical protein
MAQFCRINVMIIVYCFFRGNTTEDEGGIVEFHSENKRGRLMSWVPESWRRSVSEKWRQWSSPRVSQCSYISGDASVTSYKVIYRGLIERNTKNPYTFEFHDPAHVITGIACVPKDDKTSSPEAEVVRGGVGFKEVQIVLTPVHEGDWSCRVQINGIEDESLQIDSTSHKKSTL